MQPSQEEVKPHLRPRLVVVEQVSHQGDAQPTVCDSRFSRMTQSDEQPYGPRVVKVSEGWAHLDRGWVEEPAMMVIQNRGYSQLQVGIEVYHALPQPEAETQPAPSTVGVVATFLPGESVRWMPDRMEALRIRSLDGPGKYAITLFPK